MNYTLLLDKLKVEKRGIKGKKLDMSRQNLYYRRYQFFMHLLVFDKKNEDEKTPTIKSGQCLMLAWFSII